MDEIFDFTMILSPIISILEIAGIVVSLCYMHFTAKKRNYELSPAWYVCGVFFNFITLIVFLVKKKNSACRIQKCA